MSGADIRMSSDSGKGGLERMLSRGTGMDSEGAGRGSLDHLIGAAGAFIAAQQASASGSRMSSRKSSKRSSGYLSQADGARMTKSVEETDSMGINRSWSEHRMDMVLNDEKEFGVFLKDLVNLTEFKNVFDALKSRLGTAEEQLRYINETLNRQVLERDFVLLEEYRLTVEGAHSSRLDSHDESVARLHIQMDEATRILQDRRGELDELQGWREQAGMRLEDAFAYMGRIEDQSTVRHHNVMQAIGGIKEEALRREEWTQTQFDVVADRQTKEESARDALECSVQKINDFLSSDEFTDHIKQCCRELLHDYIPWSAMDAEACKAAKKLIAPVEQDLRQLSEKLADAKNEQALNHEESLTSIKQVNLRLQDHSSMHRKVWEAMDDRATHVKLRDTENSLLMKIGNGEEVVHSLTESATAKFEEVVKRLKEFQVILEDHEHALQHQAEELLNRATKYDLVVSAQRIDKCAMQGKVDEDIAEIHSILKYQLQKIEDVILTGVTAFDGSRSGTPGTNDLESRNTSRQTTLTKALSSVSTLSQEAGPPQAHETILVRQQLQALAEATMIFGSITLGEKALAREARRDKETEAMRHLASVLFWIEHRRVPATWNPSQLETLATVAMLNATDPENVASAYSSPPKGLKSKSLFKGVISDSVPGTPRSRVSGTQTPSESVVSLRNTPFGDDERDSASSCAPEFGYFLQEPMMSRSAQQRTFKAVTPRQHTGRGPSRQKRPHGAGVTNSPIGTLQGLAAITKPRSSNQSRCGAHDEDNLLDLVSTSLQRSHDSAKERSLSLEEQPEDPQPDPSEQPVLPPVT